MLTDKGKRFEAGTPWDKFVHHVVRKFGEDAVDEKEDALDLSSATFAKAKELLAKSVYCPTSGCWYHKESNSAETVAPWISRPDPGSHPGLGNSPPPEPDDGDGSDFSRTDSSGSAASFVRHHPTRCMLFLQAGAKRCWRPSHLALGANPGDKALRDAARKELLRFKGGLKHLDKRSQQL